MTPWGGAGCRAGLRNDHLIGLDGRSLWCYWPQRRKQGTGAISKTFPKLMFIWNQFRIQYFQEKPSSVSPTLPAVLWMKYHKTSSSVVRGIFIYHIWDFNHQLPHDKNISSPPTFPSFLVPLCLLNYDVLSPVDSSPSPTALPHPPLLHLMNISQASRDSPPPLSSYSQTPSGLSVPITFRDDSIITPGKGHLRRWEESGEHIIWRKMEVCIHLSYICLRVLPLSKNQKGAYLNTITA